MQRLRTLGAHSPSQVTRVPTAEALRAELRRYYAVETDEEVRAIALQTLAALDCPRWAA